MQGGDRTKDTAGRQGKTRERRMLTQVLVHNKYFVRSCDGAHPQAAVYKTQQDC